MRVPRNARIPCIHLYAYAHMLSEGSYESASEHSADDTKVRRTVYSPVAARPRVDNISASSPNLLQSSHATPGGPRSLGPPPPAASPRPKAVVPSTPRSNYGPSSRTDQWHSVLLQRGIPASHAGRYAKLFDEEDIEISQLTSLDERLLLALGMSSEHARMMLR